MASNKLFKLFIRLQKLQPDIKWVGFAPDGKGFYAYFQDSEPMEMGEFIYGSPTRNLLEEMSDIILELRQYHA